jgi:DNA-binding transcriptional LysR family regulator
MAAPLRLNLHFDLFDLKLFAYVADARSLTRGADRACISLAAASTRISEEIVRSVADGCADLGILAGDVHTGDFDARPFGRNQLVQPPATR